MILKLFFRTPFLIAFSFTKSFFYKMKCFYSSNIKPYNTIKVLLFLYTYIFFNHCQAPKLENPCDSRSNAFRETIALKSLLGDTSNLCGFSLTNPPSLPLKWEAQAYVKAPNTEAGDQFSYSISISGDTIVVGARYEDSNQTTITNGSTASANNSAVLAGAAYVFHRTGSNWEQQAYLKASNIESQDEFGKSVSISGDTIVVGAVGEDSNQTTITNGSTASANNSASNSGAAYVYQRNGTTWTQQAYLKAPNAGDNDEFGDSVSISGDTIVVGALGEDSNQTTITNGTTGSADNSATDAGGVYVFQRTGGNWIQQAYLKAPNSNAFDRFGSSVEISGDTIVVGSPDEDSSLTTIINGATADADNSAVDSGGAYVFQRTGTTWSQQAYLKTPNAESNDKFGSSVSISKDTIVVGAPFEDSNQTTISNGSTASVNNSFLNSGAAYVFHRTGATWVQQAYLKAENTNQGDDFGRSVSIFGDTIVVAARLEDSNQNTITNGTTASADNSISSSGAVYVFQRTGTNWEQQAYLKAPNADPGDQFGFATAISGNTIAVGAYIEGSNQNTITNGSTASSDNSASNAGAAYVFVRK